MARVLATGVVGVGHGQSYDLVELLRHTRITDVPKTAKNGHFPTGTALCTHTTATYAFNMLSPAHGRDT